MISNLLFQFLNILLIFLKIEWVKGSFTGEKSLTTVNLLTSDYSIVNNGKNGGNSNNITSEQQQQNARFAQRQRLLQQQQHPEGTRSVKKKRYFFKINFELVALNRPHPHLPPAWCPAQNNRWTISHRCAVIFGISYSKEMWFIN